jgi:formylglycine-generating enzyme required for sulfatase activity
VSDFAEIPAGWFLMGDNEGQDDERPLHRVWVDAFAMSIYPVTRAEYAAFLGATGRDTPRDWDAAAYRGLDLPVVGVSWHDALAYAEWLGDHDPGCAFRLPTEAEWERAARGGVDGGRYPWGDRIPSWIPNGGRGSLPGPWPVTLGEPTMYGLFGIAANIHEWCADWYDATYYAAAPERAPRGPSQGVRRAARGGSWRHAVTISRCGARSRLDPSFRYTDFGFRLVRNAVG